MRPAQPQLDGPVLSCDQAHIAAEPGDVSAPVVQEEQESSRKGRRPRFGAQGAVQFTRPQLHVRVAESVESGAGRGHDVADALVGGGGQQARPGQKGCQRRPAVLGEAAQLRVAARGDADPSVAEGLGGVRQDLGLRGRQAPCGQAQSGQAAVVGGVQAQRPGAGVATVPYASFARFGRRGWGGRHGGEHTHGEPPDHRV